MFWQRHYFYFGYFRRIAVHRICLRDGKYSAFELLRMKKLRFFFSGSDQPLVVMAVYDAGQVSFFDAKMEVTIFAVLILLSYTVLVKTPLRLTKSGLSFSRRYISDCVFIILLKSETLKQTGFCISFMPALSYGQRTQAHISSESRSGSGSCTKSVPTKQWKGFSAVLSSPLFLRLFFSCLRTFRFHTRFFWSSRLFCLCSDRSGIWLNQRLSGTMM